MEFAFKTRTITTNGIRLHAVEAARAPAHEEPEAVNRLMIEHFGS